MIRSNGQREAARKKFARDVVNYLTYFGHAKELLELEDTEEGKAEVLRAHKAAEYLLSVHKGGKRVNLGQYNGFKSQILALLNKINKPHGKT